MSKQQITLKDLSLQKLEELQIDLDRFLQKYALLPPVEKVRLAVMGVYPLLLEQIETKRAEAQEALANEGLLF